jgi:hypothetical protein
MLETEKEEGVEATFAPGQDLSLESTETLLEDMASTMLGAEINNRYRLYYSQMQTNGREDNEIDCSTLEMALANAKNIIKSPTVLPNTVKVTSQKIIITPEVEHPMKEEAVKDAPRFKSPEHHPYRDGHTD